MSEAKPTYCGLVCNQCPVYLAKRGDDHMLRVRTAKEWSTPGYTVLPGEVNCDGCKAENGILFKQCLQCDVRACGAERGVETCAHCENYPCDRIEFLLDILSPVARNNLRRLRNTLL